jgi:Protein of unknown function (DUF3987)
VITEEEAFAAIPPDSFLSAYIAYCAACTDSNAAFHILGGLIALAQTLPTHIGIPLGDSLLRGNIYGIVVGPSGDRKTAALKISKRMLEETSVGYITESPGSWEGLVEGLRERPQQCIFYEEFGVFLAQTEAGYQLPMKTMLTQVYDCGDIGRALAKSRKGAIKDPRVSLFGAVTPEYLERHTEPTDWEGGFFNRFLVIYANRERTFRMQPPAVTGRGALLDKLQVLASLDSFSSEPCLGYAPSAMPIWNEWYDKTQKRMHESTNNVRGALARADALVHKIALLFAWDFGDARSGKPWYITERELVPALAIIELHIRSVLALGERLAPSKILRDKLAVYRVIAERPTTLGTIITKSKVGLKKYVQELCATLVEEKKITAVQTPDNKNDAWVRASVYDEDRADNVLALFQPGPPLDEPPPEEEAVSTEEASAYDRYWRDPAPAVAAIAAASAAPVTAKAPEASAPPAPVVDAPDLE